MDDRNFRLRIGLTLLIWIILAGIIITALLTNAGVVIPLALFMGGGAVLTNGFIWNWGQGIEASTMQGKAKRRSEIHDFLETLGEDDLRELRRRLEDGADETDETGYLLGDDGELMQRSQRNSL